MDFSTARGALRRGTRKWPCLLALRRVCVGRRLWPGCCESNHRKPQRSKPQPDATPPEGAAMIAATALAIVGIIVVGFLNRIP